jgi:hypothetical protein
LRRAGDGVLRIHDLEVPVQRGFRRQGHSKQHAGELDGRGDDGGGGEEGHKGADAELAIGCEHDSSDQARA